MSDTMTQAPPAAPPGKQGQPQVVVRPFIAGTRRTDEPDYDQTLTQTAAEQRFPSYQISPNGYLRGIYLLVEATAVNTTVTTVAFNEDGPFNALSNVNLQDTNSQPIVGPLTGYDLYVLNKYGGYFHQDDAKQSTVYSAATGTATTAGSFTFVLWVPVEIVPRDGLGAQPNKSGSSQFSLVLSLAASATVYSTAPATSVSVRVRAVLAGWQDPDTNDSRGNQTAQDPPAVQTSQYWHKQTYNSLSGSVNTRLQGIDGLLRSIIFINRRQSSTRANGASDFPDPFTLKYENSLLVESRPKTLWRALIARMFNYAAAAEAAGGIDNGVFPVWEWMNDYAAKPGWESRFSYLPMSSASNLEINGIFGPSQTDDLTVLVNKVIPFPQGNVRGLTGGR